MQISEEQLSSDLVYDSVFLVHGLIVMDLVIGPVNVRVMGNCVSKDRNDVSGPKCQTLRVRQIWKVAIGILKICANRRFPCSSAKNCGNISDGKRGFLKFELFRNAL